MDQQRCGGTERERKSASGQEREARMHCLGWSLVMAAAAGLCWAEAGRAENVAVELRAAVVQLDVAKGDQREAWTFNESFPGPAIRVKEGDLVNFTFAVPIESSPLAQADTAAR